MNKLWKDKRYIQTVIKQKEEKGQESKSCEGSAKPLIGVAPLTARKHDKHHLMSKLSITPDVKIAEMLQLACPNQKWASQAVLSQK